MVKILSSVVYQTIKVFKEHCVEMIFFIISFVALILKRNSITELNSFLILSPIFITVVYCINMTFRSGKYRQLYYWIWLPLLSLLFIDNLEQWSKTPGYIITIFLLCPIAVLLSRRAISNEKFVNDVLSYFYSFVISIGLSIIVFLLVFGINFSVLYIFGFYTGKVMDSVNLYSGQGIFLLICPMIFFAILSNLFDKTKKGLRLFDIVINYIFTPALLIYNALLYIYFIKIIVLWELPKGGIAYMVFSFTMIAIAVKAMQYFVSRRMFDWFFNNFSIIAVPSLVMFWIGVARRVSEFGLTESRVWLIVSGAVMTIFLIAFIFKKLSNYFYLFVITFIVGMLMTYIPAFSAQRIAIRNQYDAAVRLSANATLDLDQARRLLSAIDYLTMEDTTAIKSLTIKSRADVMAHVSPSVKTLLRENDESERNVYLGYKESGYEIDIPTDFSKLIIPSRNENSEAYYKYANNILKIFLSDKMIFSLSLSDYLETEADHLGYDLTESEMQKASPQLLIYKDDSTFIKFNNIDLQINRNNKIDIKYLNIDFVLKKTEK